MMNVLRFPLNTLYRKCNRSVKDIDKRTQTAYHAQQQQLMTIHATMVK